MTQAHPARSYLMTTVLEGLLDCIEIFYQHFLIAVIPLVVIRVVIAVCGRNAQRSAINFVYHLPYLQ
jgi:hypothetical protein